MSTSQLDDGYASLVTWLGARDPRFSALRRAGRAALVMPAMFALGDVVIANPAAAAAAVNALR